MPNSNASSPPENPVAKVADGALQGVRNGEVLVFKGVPYGDTTGGENRFAPPRPVKPWTGIRDATGYGPSAPQINMPASSGQMKTLLGWGDDTRQGEDCLVLNIWTTALDDGRKRPVMFRIHGGGFAIGSGSWPQSDGTALARTGDVVVVTVNHRLGGLGYLYLGEIGGERYADSGNAGMLDLVAALKWVRDNIAAFGGDPDQVMIFGESGGGAKVSTLLAMPPAQGLFHRAIVQSGPALGARTKADATAAAHKVLEKLGIGASELDKLHGLPLESFSISAASGGGPVVDGRALSANPGDALAAGAAADIPLVIGFNRAEGTLLGHLTELAAIDALDEAGLRTRLAPMVQEGRLEAVIATYRRAYPDASPGDLMLSVETAQIFGVNSVRMAEIKAQSPAPVYMYRFDWSGPALGGLLKAAHGLEVPFTMNNAATSTALSEAPDSQALADRMSAAWMAFAQTGDPNVPSLPRWERYTAERPATMIFDRDCRLVVEPPSERAAWADLKLMGR